MANGNHIPEAVILIISESEDKSCDDVAEILADKQVDFRTRRNK
jgi:hypothetical protein